MTSNPEVVGGAIAMETLRSIARDGKASYPLPAEACRVRISANLPPVLSKGEVVEVDCVVENRGTATLVSAMPNPVHISYQWTDSDRDDLLPGVEGLRSLLPKALPPGKKVRCRFRLMAPPASGEFVLHVTLVQELVGWFHAFDAGSSCRAVVKWDPLESTCRHASLSIL